MRDNDLAFAAAGAWRETYEAGWKAYRQHPAKDESNRVDAAIAAAVLTYLRLCPDLESAARSLGGRTLPMSWETSAQPIPTAPDGDTEQTGEQR